MATASVPRPKPETQGFKPFVPPTQPPAELTARAVALAAIAESDLIAPAIYAAPGYLLYRVGSR